MDEVLVGVEESGGVEKRNGRLRPEKRVKKKGEGENRRRGITETEGGKRTKGSKQQRVSPSVTLRQCNGQPLSLAGVVCLPRKLESLERKQS